MLMVRKQQVYLFLIIVLFVVHAIYLSVPAEDAYITFRFARHLAAGHGIVWNVGEAPVEGYTNFLWLLISAAALKIGLPIVLFSQVLGVVVSIIAILFVYRFARRFLHLPTHHAIIACLFLAVSGPFATWGASSMETNLFALFALLGCYYVTAWIQLDSPRHLALAMGVLFLATLTRPEGFLIFGVMAGLAVVYVLARKARLHNLRQLWPLLFYMVPFIVYFVWRYQYFGYLLPNTFYAKTGGGIYQYVRGAKYTILFIALFVGPLLPVVAALVWEWNWKRSPAIWNRRLRALRNFCQNSGVYVCSLAIVAYTLYVIYVGGDYMAMFRFFVPIVPLIYLVFAHFASLLFNRLPAAPSKQKLASLAIAAAVALTVLQSTPLEQHIFDQPWFMHGTYRGVQHERWHVARNTLVGEFFEDYRRGEDESLALLGIGIIPYITSMEIRSFHGIVDPAIAHQKPTGLGQGVAGHEKVDFVSVILRKPTYIMIDTGDLYPSPQPYPDYPPEINQFVHEHYRLRAVWLTDTVNHEAGYLTFLELRSAKSLAGSE